MQATSELYKQIIGSPNHWFETTVVIGDSGVLIDEQSEKILFGGNAIIVSRVGPDSGYGETSLFGVTTSLHMVGQDVALGKAVAQEITVSMLRPKGEIPIMGVIVPYVRVCNATQQSEWIQRGVFFIDTREESDNDDGLDIIKLHGYDAMLKAEQDYGSTELDWPATDTDVVREIAGKIGVSVDPRTFDIMTDGFSIPLPSNYSLREVLGYIAGAYVGCFIMSDVGELRLVSLADLPKETRYLIDNNGNAIVFGGGPGAIFTVSGAEVNIQNPGGTTVLALSSQIPPAQQGSGDPGLTNVRPIITHTGLQITQNTNVHSADWTYISGPVAVGAYNADGALERAAELVTFDGSSDEAWGAASSANGYYIDLPGMMLVNQYGLDACMCNRLPKGAVNTRLCIRVGSASNPRVVVSQANTISGVSDLATWRAWLAENPIELTYALAEPQQFAVQAISVELDEGNNSISSSTGNVTVTYQEAGGEATRILV